MDEQDDLDSWYAQRDDEQRRDYEERILAHGRKVADEFSREVREWLKETCT